MILKYFLDGGFAMYPVAALGLLAIAASLLYAMRRDTSLGSVTVAVSVAALAMGLCGTAVGISSTCRAVREVPGDEQLAILVEGINESLHNAVLALMCIVLVGIIAAIGALRRPLSPRET
jgi:drug/metabolite transporter (DMT)-like permease